MKIAMGSVVCALMFAAPVFGQAAPVSAGQQSTSLLTGTSVQLRMKTELTTKDKRAKVGDRFALEVTEPVSLNGATVIPVGAVATGEITTVRNKGMFGKSGLIEARMLHVRVGDRQIRLTGRVDDKGSKNGVGAGVATYATLVGGFLITGTSAVIPAGTMVTAYLEEDVPVAFASGLAPVKPLVVPAN
jgi:hypothetical protein